ncbi:uncharacterized protein LOC103853200 [Brassica rapa]|uniref:uncharacterized protein LOC103853200 n=1 Tax=Brassica campestris TaxID=3711 RepID=UPI00142E713B|nr:uncharacterized protein LOC103853200 [Brassica rapa]XP_033141358.1 uncharacterized protein LOC103853200 [Brassica rapa]XP_033141359.1 uncharacterized protein LOC103853200 [Brassica rapa]XP_033141360.1 uncharacterized protein LOC103853200 [Brassica rapa]XP_033141361.1 uncharacterized protein LOC103853200 [Brassica rapa]XP_033141362.1 uncharacterized protein LOC103853200 [Brassica rapa]XP_033141363.1 uncharacterized protein LOC103853200 [Brassica rapa]XP_033141364.1 uncharacterized protein 
MSVKLFFWNVCGLNDPDKHRSFVSWLHFHKPIFGAILETHVKELSLLPLKIKLCPGWKFASNHHSDDDGRIILIWKDPLKIQIVHQSSQSITCAMEIPNLPPFFYTAVYASNLTVDRSDLWAKLLYLHDSLNLQNYGWIVGGDFNQILMSSEHSSQSVNAQDYQMYQFQDCLTQTGLFDLRYNGPSHTWKNNQPDMPIAKKLDRLLINCNTISAFPHASANFLPPDISDHTPCLLDLAYQLPKAGTQPFKFQNYLTKHPEFTMVIHDAWTRAGSNSWTLTQLCWKLKLIKTNLKILNRDNFSKIQERVTETYNLLQTAQVHSLQAPSQQLFLEEKELHDRWMFLRQIEECFFRQKSRINWLTEGDLNTTYFHRICQVQASYNAIRSFITESGIQITDPQEMSNLAIAHFQSVLGPLNYRPPCIASHPSWFALLTNFRVTSLQSTQMQLIPTALEIRKQFFKLNQNKAPFPDGLTSGFFKASWDILGEEVVHSIQHFFASSFLPAATNATILSLIPKFPGASKITDFRPISCLNTVYKVLSRLLVARLKPFLPDLILPSQTAFVKDRLLVENTTLASELIHGYHKNKGSKRIAIKVDIAKAFDILSWEFLLSSLEAIEVPQRFISWIKACICTTKFTVGYNGVVNGYFKGKRGLRQGDPLSPYLFVIAMNYLSMMLNEAARNEKIKYHNRCDRMKLTHLSFADDLLIFIDGSLSSVQNVLQVLREFEHRSGLAVSFQKTSFYASGLSEEELSTIQASTGMHHGSLPFRYLGVPLNSRKLSIVNCEPLLHQVKTRFSSWSVKSLSFAGRLLLIKTVIAGITTFWCSAFILPKACINKINSMCSFFLWKGNLEGHHSAKVAWETVTLTKAQGGLGIKDLHVWNKSCSLRLIWIIIFREDSVWAAWFKEVVLKGSLQNYWTVKPSQKNSWLVNKLIKMRTKVFPLIKMRIENGRTARFWLDNWAPTSSLTLSQTLPGGRFGIPLSATVASLRRNGSWRLPPARSEVMLELYAYMTMIELTEREDYYEWEIQGATTIKFSTGAIYTNLRGTIPDQSWTKTIWIPRAIPRHSFHSWLVTLNQCPTRDRMIQWGLQIDPTCLLCNLTAESRDHLYFVCPYSFGLWTLVASQCRIRPQRTWESTITQMEMLSIQKPYRLLTLLSWQATMYWLWKERNDRHHNNIFRTVDSIFSQLDRQIRNKIQSFRKSNPTLASKMMQRWFDTTGTSPPS